MDRMTIYLALAANQALYQQHSVPPALYHQARQWLNQRLRQEGGTP